ncbi:halocyanin domain-containing protein [Halorussus lipolyticus]|uniref:halocyanin domain-containing protein n=1 Tax=Halorussus lipolyticus TaxID=3034024 RepID=UPI003B20F602
MTNDDTTTGRTHGEATGRETTDRAATRRDVLKAGGTATAAVAGLSGSATASEGGSDLSSWFEGVSNYDGVADKTGESEVTIEVGAQGNNGAFAFGPAAVRVDPGTKVVWKWTGKGGSHNVVSESGDFESEMVSDEGHTFSQTFEEKGVHKYACSPHKAMGMKGAVVVGDTEVGSSGYDLGASEYAIGGSILLGLLSPIAFAWVLFKRDPDGPSR